jgi:hypothetical protein
MVYSAKQHRPTAIGQVAGEVVTGRLMRFCSCTVRVLLCLVAASANVAWAREPVFVVTVAGLDRALDDVDHLARLAERPEVGGFVRGMYGAFNSKRGLDGKRPISLFAFLPDNAGPGVQPEFALLVPVGKIEDLQAALKLTRRVTLKSEETEGRYSLQIGKKSVPVQVHGDWAVVSESESLLSEESIREERWTAVLGESDAVAYVGWSHLPSSVFQEIESRMARDAAAQQTRREGESDFDYEARQTGRELASSAFSQLFHDADSLTARLDVSSKSKSIRTEVSIFPKSGSALAQSLASLPVVSPFAAQAQRPDPLSLSLSIASPDKLQAALSKMVEQLRQEVRRKTVGADELRAIEEAISAIAPMIASESYAGYLRIAPTADDRISIAAAAANPQAKQFADLMTRYLPEAGKSPDVRGLTMRAHEAGGIAFHRIVPAQSRSEDEELFGPNAAVYVGSGKGAVWLAVSGSGADQMLTSMVEPAPASAAIASTSPLLRAALHLKPWEGFLRKTNDSPPHVRDAMLEALHEIDRDEISLQLDAGERGLTLSLAIDDALLQVLGAAITAEEQGPPK